MSSDLIDVFSSRPVVQSGYMPRQRIVQDKEFLFLLKNKKWSGPVLVDVTGVPACWMYHDGDDKVSGIYFYYGRDSYESLSCIMFGVLSSAAETVYDVGGHCGVYSLIAAASGARNIHYFDLMASVADRFEINIKLNGYTGLVRLNRFGLSSRSGKVEFNYNEVKMTTGASIEYIPRTFSSNLARRGVAEVVSLDEYWLGRGKGSVQLMKMDVETHEIEVLRGGGQFFSENQPHVLSEVLSYEQFKDLYQAFRCYGYECAYEIDDNEMLLRRIFPDMMDAAGNEYVFKIYHNVLFTKAPLAAEVIERIVSLVRSSPNACSAGAVVI